MTKSEIKTLVLFIITFLFVFVFCYIVFTKEEEHNNSLNANIIVDGSRFLEYKNLRWSDLKNLKSVETDQFKVYSDNNYFGDYFVTSANDMYYFFDSDYNSYEVDSKFLAISKNSSLSIIDYNKENFNEEDNRIINKYLGSIDIKYYGDYSIKEKYVTNLNNDEDRDYIYILCNDSYSDNVFYVIFAKVSNKLITINKQVNVDNLEKYELAWILNTTNDSYNDIILNINVFESFDYYLYSYNGDKEYNEILEKMR